jgi:Clp amino terminal domain, pathogenicity island component
VGTEHLLLGLFGEDTVASRAMESVGLTRAAVTGAVRAIVGECPELASRPDPDALAAVGIDLEVVRRSIEASFGPGALEGTRAWRRSRARRFTPRVKKTLQLALREALSLEHPYLGPEHVLLGLVREAEGVAAAILGRQSGSLAAVREAVMGQLRRPA